MIDFLLTVSATAIITFVLMANRVDSLRKSLSFLDSENKELMTRIVHLNERCIQAGLISVELQKKLQLTRDQLDARRETYSTAVSQINFLYSRIFELNGKDENMRAKKDWQTIHRATSTIYTPNTNSNVD